LAYSPELVRRWWHANRSEMTVCEIDLRRSVDTRHCFAFLARMRAELWGQTPLFVRRFAAHCALRPPRFAARAPARADR